MTKFLFRVWDSAFGNSAEQLIEAPNIKAVFEKVSDTQLLMELEWILFQLEGNMKVPVAWNYQYGSNNNPPLSG
jgi:hypothetical protein